MQMVGKNNPSDEVKRRFFLPGLYSQPEEVKLIDQDWYATMGDMRKKVDISLFEIASDVGHGKKITR